MNPAIGLVCGLTNEKATFEINCPDFNIDQEEADRLIKLERDAKEEEESTGIFATEKKALKAGVWGGITMIVAALIWFIAGLANGYIYFYPPILFGIGIFAIIKGLKRK